MKIVLYIFKKERADSVILRKTREYKTPQKNTHKV